MDDIGTVPGSAAQGRQYGPYILSAAIRQLFITLSKTPYDELTNILEMISRTNPDEAEILYKQIQTWEKEIAAFHALVIYPMADNEQSWTILRWKEVTREVLAIFSPDDDDSQICSWLMYINRHNGSSLDWHVLDITALKSLFLAAQHLLGILEMPKEVVSRIYAHEDSGNISMEEYADLLNSCLL
jgi:hypothetical protein